MENLPLPGKFATMWQKVQKMVDGLHISNHRREICETHFHPKRFKEANPDLMPNSMAAEQTFAWMGRYKKQICSLQQMFMRTGNYTMSWKIGRGRQIQGVVSMN